MIMIAALIPPLHKLPHDIDGKRRQVQQDGPNDDLLDSQGSFRVLCRELFWRGLWGRSSEHGGSVIMVELEIKG